eukprot:sb/3461011/
MIKYFLIVRRLFSSCSDCKSSLEMPEETVAIIGDVDRKEQRQKRRSMKQWDKEDREEEKKQAGTQKKTKRQNSAPQIFETVEDMLTRVTGERKKRTRTNTYSGQKRVSFDTPELVSEEGRKRLQSLNDRKRLDSVSEDKVDLEGAVEKIGQRKRMDSNGGNKLVKLFENPFGEEEEEEKEGKGTFQKLSRQQTHLLRKKILYKGEYMVLNFSVLIIAFLLLFGIIFMSAWHYTNNNFWVLYLVLGLVTLSICTVLVSVKMYFKLKRYHGSTRHQTTADICFQNQAFGMEEGVESSGTKKAEEGSSGTINKKVEEDNSSGTRSDDKREFQEAGKTITGMLAYLIVSFLDVCSIGFFINTQHLVIVFLENSWERERSDPDLPGLDLPEPRFTGRIYFPRYGKITGGAMSIPVNRGPTVLTWEFLLPGGFMVHIHVGTSKKTSQIDRIPDRDSITTKELEESVNSELREPCLNPIIRKVGVALLAAVIDFFLLKLRKGCLERNIELVEAEVAVGQLSVGDLLGEGVEKVMVGGEEVSAQEYLVMVQGELRAILFNTRWAMEWLTKGQEGLDDPIHHQSDIATGLRGWYHLTLHSFHEAINCFTSISTSPFYTHLFAYYHGKALAKERRARGRYKEVPSSEIELLMTASDRFTCLPSILFHNAGPASALAHKYRGDIERMLKKAWEARDGYHSVNLSRLASTWMLFDRAAQPKAEELYKLALDLKPGCSFTLHRYGSHLFRQADRLDEGINLMVRANNLPAFMNMVAMVTRAGHMTLQQVIEKVDSTYPDIIPPIRCVMYLVHKAALLGLAIHHLKRLYTATQGGVVELPERTVADLRRWQAVESGCVDVMREWAILGIGVYGVSKTTVFDSAFGSGNLVSILPISFITFGCALFVIGFTGCCSTMFQVKCLLNLHLTIVTIILLAELAIIALTFAMSETVTETLTKELKNSGVEQYGKSSMGVTQGGVVELPERTVADLRRWQAVESGCVDVMREWAILGIGVYGVSKTTVFDSAFGSGNLVSILPISFITFGCALFVIGFTGCCSTMFQVKCLLNLHLTIVTIILLAELAIIALTFAMSETVTETLTKELKNSGVEHSMGVITDAMDKLQLSLKCCGANSTEDWKATWWYNRHPYMVPWSCCEDRDKFDEECPMVQARGIGCAGAFLQLINKRMAIIYAGIVGLSHTASPCLMSANNLYSSIKVPREEVSHNRWPGIPQKHCNFQLSLGRREIHLYSYPLSERWMSFHSGKFHQHNFTNHVPTKTSKQPIRTRYLGHVTGYYPIRDQYFLIRSVHVTHPSRFHLHHRRNLRGIPEVIPSHHHPHPCHPGAPIGSASSKGFLITHPASPGSSFIPFKRQ